MYLFCVFIHYVSYTVHVGLHAIYDLNLNVMNQSLSDLLRCSLVYHYVIEIMPKTVQYLTNNYMNYRK